VLPGNVEKRKESDIEAWVEDMCTEERFSYAYHHHHHLLRHHHRSQKPCSHRHRHHDASCGGSCDGDGGGDHQTVCQAE